MGDTPAHKAHNLYNEGMLRMELGQMWEAKDYFEKALDLYQTISGTERNRAFCMISIGNTLATPVIRDLEEAEKYYLMGLELLRKEVPGSTADQALCLSNLGRIFFEEGRFPDAQTHFEQAIFLYEKLPPAEFDPRDTSSCYLYFGYTLMELGMSRDALRQFELAFSIYERCSAPLEIFADLLVTVGRLLKRAGFLQESQNYLQKALSIYEQMPESSKTAHMVKKCRKELNVDVAEHKGIVWDVENIPEAQKLVLDRIILFCEALQRGDFKALKKLAYKAETARAAGSGMTIVPFECFDKLAQAVVLVAGDAKIYLRDVFLLYSEAIKRDDREFLMRIVQCQGWVNACNEKGQTPLHMAAYNGMLEISGYLIAYGSDLNARDRNGFTPLHLAAHEGHSEVLKLLIASGAAVNVQDNGKRSALHWAMQRGHHEAANILRQHIARNL